MINGSFLRLGRQSDLIPLLLLSADLVSSSSSLPGLDCEAGQTRRRSLGRTNFRCIFPHTRPAAAGGPWACCDLRSLDLPDVDVKEGAWSVGLPGQTLCYLHIVCPGARGVEVFLSVSSSIQTLAAMLRTSSIVVSSGWKRMASSAKLNTKYVRQLSSKEGPKTAAKPESIPKAKQSSGLGTALGLALATITALQLPTVLREHGVIDFDPYENVPVISEFLAPLTDAMRAADLLPAKKTATAVEKKQAEVYHHKTTAEVMAESHKSDPYGVPDLEPAHEPVKESVVEVAAVASEELTVAEHEAVHVAESAVDDVATVVTDTVIKSEEVVEATVNPAEIISEALTTATPSAEEALQAA
eukprot:gene17927-20769_t